MRKLKLIWDFRGPVAERTAQHHEIHLKEYLQLESMEYTETGFKALNEMHAIAWVVVEESLMPKVRDALKPHRGEVFTS